jgi:hypothetical protein
LTGVTDEGELQLAAADGSSDHHAGVDPNADPKLATESLGDAAVNHHRAEALILTSLLCKTWP